LRGLLVVDHLACARKVLCDGVISHLIDGGHQSSDSLVLRFTLLLRELTKNVVSRGAPVIGTLKIEKKSLHS
jgi:hypothetical protein